MLIKPKVKGKEEAEISDEIVLLNALDQGLTSGAKELVTLESILYQNNNQHLKESGNVVEFKEDSIVVNLDFRHLKAAINGSLNLTLTPKDETILTDAITNHKFDASLDLLGNLISHHSEALVNSIKNLKRTTNSKTLKIDDDSPFRIMLTLENVLPPTPHLHLVKGIPVSLFLVNFQTQENLKKSTILDEKSYARQCYEITYPPNTPTSII